MTWVDYAIVGLIALSAIVGFARGLLREVLSLVIWIGAILIAWTFYREFAGFLEPWIQSPSLRLGAAFLILLFAVLVLGTLFGHLLSLLVTKTGLTGTDRVLGVAFGAARGAILVAMLVFMAALTPLAGEQWWHSSSLIGRFQVLAKVVLDQVPTQLTERLERF